MQIDEHFYKRVQAIREGGHTSRSHTIPHHGEYSVAFHTWNVVTLLLLLHPSPSLELIKAAQFHDVPELYAGDVPGHAKYWHSPAMGDMHAALERVLSRQLGLQFSLTKDEERWLKGCDLLEFYLWCCDQEALGNRNVVNVKDNVLRYMAENADDIPLMVVRFISGYAWQRTPETGYWNDE